jgi:hypothetical protein
MNGPRSSSIRSAAHPASTPELRRSLDELDASAAALDELDEQIDRELQRRRTPAPAPAPPRGDG